MAAPPSVPLLEYPRWLRTSPRADVDSPTGELTEEWYAAMRALFHTDEDRQLLENLIARRVTVTVFDSILFTDLIYRDGGWTSHGWHAGGCASSRSIEIARNKSVERDARTLVHEELHTWQSPFLNTRDAELAAYVEEEAWAIAHQLPEVDDLRKTSEDGELEPDAEKIRAMIDRDYPGMLAPPSEGGVPEQIISVSPDRTTVTIRTEDGREYTRAPQEGDVVPRSRRVVTNPQVVDLRRLL